MEKHAIKQPIEFAADRMLGRLTRWMRILGANVIADPRVGGAAILARARRDGRVTITRDKRLRTAPDVIWLANDDLADQLREVLRHYPLTGSQRAFTRCVRCNTPLGMVTREEIGTRVPPFVYASHESFSFCNRCGKIYWDATHRARAIEALERIGIGAGHVFARHVPACWSK